MSYVIVTEQYLSDIASAIRSATGYSSGISPRRMASVLSSVFPNTSYFDEYASQYPEEIRFPEHLSEIRPVAFMQASITTVDLPNVYFLGKSAFASCYKLTHVDLPNATTIDSDAFFNCSKLTDVSIPAVTTIGNRAFGDCISISEINLPSATNVGTYTFQQCYNLRTVKLPVASTIGQYVFSRCFNLLSLYLLGSSVTTLTNKNAFQSTPISTYTASTGGVYGSIFVPSSLYNDYIAATNWSLYAARFVSV